MTGRLNYSSFQCSAAQASGIDLVLRVNRLSWLFSILILVLLGRMAGSCDLDVVLASGDAIRSR